MAIRPTAGDPVFGPLLAATREHRMDVVVGFVEKTGGTVSTSRRRISAAVRCGTFTTRSTCRRTRYLTRALLAWGDTVRAFDTRGRVGVLICEDFWHASPPYLLWLDGADVLLLHSASPGRGLDEAIG